MPDKRQFPHHLIREIFEKEFSSGGTRDFHRLVAAK